MYNNTVETLPIRDVLGDQNQAVFCGLFDDLQLMKRRKNCFNLWWDYFTKQNVKLTFKGSFCNISMCMSEKKVKKKKSYLRCSLI